MLFLSECSTLEVENYGELEIPASRVFLGADAQLLGTSLGGVRKSLRCLVLCQQHASETK